MILNFLSLKRTLKKSTGLNKLQKWELTISTIERILSKESLENKKK